MITIHTSEIVRLKNEYFKLLEDNFGQLEIHSLFPDTINFFSNDGTILFKAIEYLGEDIIENELRNRIKTIKERLSKQWKACPY